MSSVTRRPARPRLRALFAAALAVVGLAATALVAPAILTPDRVSQAHAAVYQCGCPQSAYDLRSRWENLGFPAGAAWHQVGANKWIFGGAVHQNREGQLPKGARYREYDAQYYTQRGRHRGAKRIVVDIATDAAWYSPNHYTDFYRM
jgi:ribonuclease T1